MLTAHGANSLVGGRLCDQTKGQHIAVACFYVDFIPPKERSVTRMLGYGTLYALLSVDSLAAFRAYKMFP